MRKVTMIVTAIAVLGLLVAVPMATAKTSNTDKAQNRAIQKNAKAVKNAAAGVKKNTKQIASSTKAVGKAIAALSVIANRGDKTAAAIAAAAPAIISGLTQLKDGLTAAGAGLNSLKTLATSTEYGVAQVSINGTPVGAATLVTPDIPDTVQQAQVSQTFIAGAGTTGQSITLNAVVRSAESDGTGASNPAAYCRATIISGSTATTSSPATTGPLTGTPFYPINNKSPQIGSTGFPFGLVASDVTPLDLTQVGTNAVAGPGGAATATAGSPYTVTLACVDPSASSTDPSA